MTYDELMELLPDPDMLCVSEYRAVHELLEDALHPNNYGEEDDPDVREHALAILKEAREWTVEISHLIQAAHTDAFLTRLHKIAFGCEDDDGLDMSDRQQDICGLLDYWKVRGKAPPEDVTIGELCNPEDAR